MHERESEKRNKFPFSSFAYSLKGGKPEQNEEIPREQRCSSLEMLTHCLTISWCKALASLYQTYGGTPL